MKLVPGIALALLLGAVACSKAKQPPPATQPMASEVATKIESTMKSPDKATRAQALAPELRDAYLKDSKGEYPAGTTVAINRGSFRQIDEKYGLVEAEVGGRGAHDLLLVRQGGEWNIFDMRPKQATSAPVTPTQSSIKLAANALSVSTCEQGFGKRVPVLFVHGLNAEKQMWAEDTVYGAVGSMSDVFRSTFDYKPYHSLWVDHPEIGPKLARQIACLANESRKSGGPGKVVVVAHSMGGLATRFAADQPDEFTGKKVGDNLGLVVTIGTPNKGTAIAELSTGLVRLACMSAWSLVNLDPKACINTQSAIVAMQMYVQSGKVDDLPELPGTPLLAIAGDVHSFFYYLGVPLPVSGSDLVVPVGSAAIGSKDRSKGGGVEVVKCSSIHPYPIANPATCEHGNLVKDAKVKEHAVAGITKYLSSLRGPVIKFHGMTLPLPAGWKVISQKPDEWEVQDNCPGGKCRTFFLLGPGELYTEPCGELLENRAFKMGTRPAKYMRSECISGISHTWVTTNEPLVAASSWDPPPAGLEELLSNVTWS